MLHLLAYLAAALGCMWLAAELLPQLAASAPIRPSTLPAAALPLYERMLWLARHPLHRLLHALLYLLCSACWPLLRRRTPARVVADGAALAGLCDSGATAGVGSFHLEALEYQMPAFATWLPYGPIYPWGKQVANKLRLVAWRETHPECAAVALKRPLWVVGLPRTGSTIFHKLMSLDDEARSVRAWELRHPVPPAKPEAWAADPRFQEFNKVRAAAPAALAENSGAAPWPRARRAGRWRTPCTRR